LLWIKRQLCAIFGSKFRNSILNLKKLKALSVTRHVLARLFVIMVTPFTSCEYARQGMTASMAAEDWWLTVPVHLNELWTLLPLAQILNKCIWARCRQTYQFSMITPIESWLLLALKRHVLFRIAKIHDTISVANQVHVTKKVLNILAVALYTTCVVCVRWLPEIVQFIALVMCKEEWEN
jgi:hypothetical protein